MCVCVSDLLTVAVIQVRLVLLQHLRSFDLSFVFSQLPLLTATDNLSDSCLISKVSANIQRKILWNSFGNEFCWKIICSFKEVACFVMAVVAQSAGNWAEKQRVLSSSPSADKTWTVFC